MTAPADAEALNALRRVVAEACPALDEGVKWNGPNFTYQGADRVTLGVQKGGGVRMVLHRGAKPKDAAAFRFEDSSGLAAWPSSDRGVVVLADAEAVERRADALGDLVRRWIDAAG